MFCKEMRCSISAAGMCVRSENVKHESLGCAVKVAHYLEINPPPERKNESSRHRPTVGSKGQALSHEPGTSVRYFFTDPCDLHIGHQLLPGSFQSSGEGPHWRIHSLILDHLSITASNPCSPILHRGTSLIRKRTLIKPYSRPMPWALG